MGAAPSQEQDTGYGGITCDDEDDVRHSIRSGDLAKIKELAVQRGFDVNASNENGDSPLHLAVRLNQASLVDELVEGGATLDAINTAGDQPLHLACRMGRYEMVRALLQAGAQVDGINKDHLTSLHIVCQGGSKIPTDTLVRIVHLLCKAGAYTEAVDKAGRSPLHLAAMAGSVAHVSALIQNEARRGFQDNDGKRAMDYAEAGKFRAVVNYLNSVDHNASEGKLRKYDKYLG